MMSRILFSLFLLVFIFIGRSAEITLSTVSFTIPDAAAAGNKVIITNDGISTYAWNRLKLDSSCYYYSYSFKLENALFEFRECHKVDIYESFETMYKPKYAKSKEAKNYDLKRFVDTPNEFMRNAYQGAFVEFNKGMRKITFLYNINKTGLMMISIKSKFSAENFLKAQAALDSILITAKYNPPTPPLHEEVIQKGVLESKTKHTAIRLPFFAGTDFNNPVVKPTSDNGFVVVFAHAKGSEIIKINQENKIEYHTSHDKIIHDIAISDKGFFSLSSTDYNKLSYGIYPSLYLNKHNHQGQVELSQVVFKQNDVKLPGNQVFDYYSRDGVSLEISDTFGVIYCSAEKRWPDMSVIQSGAYKTFSLENGILKKGSQDLFHLSHCFSQVSVSDTNFAYLVSLSDAYPRGVCLSKVDLSVAKDSTDTTSFYHHMLYKISGTNGDNYVADTHISEPVLFNNYIYVIIETEEGARTTIESNQNSSNKGHNDLFLVKCELNTKELVVKQLTKTDKIEEVNPKLVRYGDDLLLIYTEAKLDKQSNRYSFEDKYLLLGERGGRESMLESFNSYYANENRIDYKMPDSPINRDGSNLITMSDGTIVWVRLLKNAQEIEVIRIH